MPTIDVSGTVCVLAWNGLEIDSKGNARICCQYQGLLQDNSGDDFNVSRHSIDEIRKSKSLQDLRQQMLAGDKPSTCQKCWQDEASGKSVSLRQWANSQFQLDPAQIGEQPAALESMGIALGNVCNLRCRICGPWASSVWAVDEIRRLGKSHSHNEKMMLEQGAWPIKSATFWPDFERHLGTIKHLSFYGGEPFMVPKHLEILDKLATTNTAGEISLLYSTNATIFPSKHVDFFAKFKKVTIRCSVDDIGQRFEYQRKNADWQETQQVIGQYLSVKKLHVTIACAVSVYNALYLQEILENFQQLWPKININLDMVVLDKYHCIANAPEEFKNAVRDRLNIETFDSDLQNQLKYILNSMYSAPSDPKHWNDFKQVVKTIDNFRGELLAQSHPELADFLQ
jgi:MoaA/NifB/PqqE/SkfB family radical SAM enzyme